MLPKTVRVDSSIKLVLFDHDDTLVRTMKGKWAQHKYIAEIFYGKKLSNNELRLHWGKPFTLLMQLLYETENLGMAMCYNIATRQQFPKHLFRNTIRTLSKLRNSGKKIGLISSTTRWSLNYDFQTLKIPSGLFDYVQTEEDTALHKPDPRVFAPVFKWLEQEEIQPHQVLYVGDQLNDMLAAQQAGFDFVGIGTGLTSIEEFESHQVANVPQLHYLVESK